MQVVVGMGNTTGNLEGLMLALPGYESSEHEDYLIHSVSPGGNLRVYGAIQGSRAKKVVIGTSSRDVTEMVDALDGGRSGSPSDNDSSIDPDSFLQVYVNKIPDLDDLDGPPKTIAKLLKTVSLSVQEGKGDLRVQVKLTTNGEKHAEQLQQLAQGLIAMVGILQDSEDADEDLQMVAEILEGLKVERSGDSVELDLEVSESIVIDFLRDEVDLPLSK